MNDNDLLLELGFSEDHPVRRELIELKAEVEAEQGVTMSMRKFINHFLTNLAAQHLVDKISAGGGNDAVG